MFFSRSPRFPVQFTAVYDDGERYLTAPVTNLSGSGLFIETLAPADEGASVHIVPLLPPSRGLPELQGVVVRVQDGKAELGRAQPAGMGIRFVALGDGDAEQLRDYCENLKLAEADAKHEQVQGKDRDKPATVKTPDPVVGYRGLSLQKKEAAQKEAAQKEAAQKEAAARAEAQKAESDSAADASAADATSVDVDAETRVSETTAAKAYDTAEAKDALQADAAAEPVEPAPDAESIASDKAGTSAAGADEVVTAAPSHAEARTTAAVSDEDAMPMLADDDAELVETAEASRLEKASAEEPIPLEKTKRQPVLLDKRKSVEASAEDTDATEPDTVRPEVTARSSVDVSEPPAVEDTPDGETEKIDRTLTQSQTAWDIPADDQPYANLLRGDDELGAVVAPRGQGAVIALGVLNLIAVGGAIAYGAYRLDSVDQRQHTADTRLTTVAQDVGFVSERTKTLQRGLDGQDEALAALSEVVLKSPSLTQSIEATPAGVPGRYVVQTAATIANPDVGEGEVVYVTRRVLVGNLGAVPVALGKVQNINGVADKGQVAWTVLEEEQHLSDGAKLKHFAALTKKERSELKKGAKVGDVVGPLAAGGTRADRRQLLLDLPQGGLLGVETEVGLIVDDQAVTLKHVETTGVPAVVVPVER